MQYLRKNLYIVSYWAIVESIESNNSDKRARIQKRRTSLERELLFTIEIDFLQFR